MTGAPVRAANRTPVYAYRRRASKSGIPRDDPEHRLQRAVVTHLRECGLKVYSTLNGVQLGYKQRQKALEDGLIAGPLDLFTPIKGIDHWLEMKIKPNGPTAAQIVFMEERPGLCGVCYSMEDVIALFGRWGVFVPPYTNRWPI